MNGSLTAKKNEVVIDGIDNRDVLAATISEKGGTSGFFGDLVALAGTKTTAAVFALALVLPFALSVFLVLVPEIYELRPDNYLDTLSQAFLMSVYPLLSLLLTARAVSVVTRDKNVLPLWLVSNMCLMLIFITAICIGSIVFFSRDDLLPAADILSHVALSGILSLFVSAPIVALSLSGRRRAALCLSGAGGILSLFAIVLPRSVAIVLPHSAAVLAAYGGGIACYIAPSICALAGAYILLKKRKA